MAEGRRPAAARLLAGESRADGPDQAVWWVRQKRAAAEPHAIVHRILAERA